MSHGRSVMGVPDRSCCDNTHENGGSTMLVLTRKNQETVVVVGGTDGFESILKVTVLRIKGGSVVLGFEAAADVPVHRLEVWERIRASNGRKRQSDVRPRGGSRVLTPCGSSRHRRPLKKGRSSLRFRSRQSEQRIYPEARGAPPPEGRDDMLIPDDRAGLTPADMVERKLLSLLHGCRQGFAMYGGVRPASPSPERPGSRSGRS